jgi:predicted dehydrogenase
MGNAESNGLTRRDFLRTGAALGVGSSILAFPEKLYAAGGSGALRVGLVGTGGRGTGAARDMVNSSEGIEIVAMGNLRGEKLATSRAQLAERIPEAYRVDDEHVFLGFDAYRHVIESDIDVVILATPPHFRPAQLRAAVEAGKHVFMEKPIAVDPVGVRSIIESAEMAAQKGLAIVAGTQRRHDPKYIETVRRIHAGEIGDVTSGHVYWNQGGLWNFERLPGMSDMEWQIRNWLYFTWTGGDHIVEQHIHNIDVANWVMGGPPVRAYGTGGRQVRVDPSYGHIFDHFMIELEYANGGTITSMCRQQPRTAGRNAETFTGTNGSAQTSGRTPWVRGANEWQWAQEGEAVNPYVQEHADLIASIRAGTPLNEGRQVAESTLTAILAREAAYTGQVITWDEIMASDLDLTPGPLEFGPLPFPPVPQPGVTRLSRPPFAHSHPTG